MKDHSTILFAILFLILTSVNAAEVSSYSPTNEQREVTEAIESTSFVDEAAWSQKISFWVFITDDGSMGDKFLEQFAYSICIMGKGKGIEVPFFVHLWDSRAALSGNAKRYIDRVVCR